MKRSLAFLALCLVGCAQPPEITAEASLPASGDCLAQASSTLGEPLFWPQADYATVVSACVMRKTPGFIDVQAWLLATSYVDVHALVSIEGEAINSFDIVGGEVQATLGNSAATTLLGSHYVEPGAYTLSIRVATGAPDATVAALAGTWIMGTARPQ
jgi:hypothetical protein